MRIYNLKLLNLPFFFVLFLRRTWKVQILCALSMSVMTSNISDMYRVIRKSLRDFRPLRHSSRDGHAEGEHVNIGRDTPNFCPTLQVLLPHMLQVCGRNLITGLTSAASPRVDISSTCKAEQKMGVFLALLTCSPLA